MLATMIPLFDSQMAVRAYSLFAQKENLLLKPNLMGTGSLDGSGNILGLEVVDTMGINTLDENQDVLIEISRVTAFANIDELCSVPHDRIILLVDKTIPCDQMYIKRFQQLKFMGYKLALKNIKVEQFSEYAPFLKLMDYIMLDYKKINMQAAQAFFSKVYPDISLIAVNVNSQEDYDNLTQSDAYSLYEGDFYRLPVTKGVTKVAPLKVNYIELLNIVNNPDFELTKAADIIGRDTALVIKLLKMVNHMSINSEITSIRHAAAMLGQKELKKWINAVVTNGLCADKPNEITRVSLLRAKFAENMAPLFEMASSSAELFLMGLFSVLDIILDKPMTEALKMVNVSKQITDALVDHKGQMWEVFDFLVAYEKASWSEVDRVMLLKNIDDKAVYQAYLDALSWYRDLFGDDSE